MLNVELSARRQKSEDRSREEGDDRAERWDFSVDDSFEMTTELEGDFSPAEAGFEMTWELRTEYDNEFLFMIFSLWGVRLSKLLRLRRMNLQVL